MMGPRDGIGVFLFRGVFCSGVGESQVASVRGISPKRKVRARMGLPGSCVIRIGARQNSVEWIIFMG